MLPYKLVGNVWKKKSRLLKTGRQWNRTDYSVFSSVAEASSTNAFSRLNSSLDFTPSQAGTYTVYVYAFDDSGFLLGKWNTRISVQ